MSKINKNIIIFLIIFGVVSFFVVPVLASDLGLKATSDVAGLTRSDTIPVIIGNLIGAALSFVGVLFFALMLYGGILWMLSRGNQEMEKKALNTITGAIIGIIIVVSSYAITNFVFKGIEGGSTTTSSSSQCSGKTGSVSGCDTCTATQGEGWSCRPLAECSDVEGEKVDNLCRASGQGNNIKCCKAKEGDSTPDVPVSCVKDNDVFSETCGDIIYEADCNNYEHTYIDCEYDQDAQEEGVPHCKPVITQEEFCSDTFAAGGGCAPPYCKTEW